MRWLQRSIAKSYLKKASGRLREAFPPVACFAFDHISTEIFISGRYEDHHLAVLEAELFPILDRQTVCLDVGANIGNHALAFSPHFKRVFCFEPHPRSFQLLGFNAALSDNITALNTGLSDVVGVVEARETANNIGATTIEARPAGSDFTSSVSFRVDRLDDLAAEVDLGKIGFMKIDVEGHGLQVLRGGIATIRSNRPVIALEVLRSSIESGSSAEIDLLRSIGYRHFYEIEKAPSSASRLYQWLVGRFGRKPASALRPIGALDSKSYPMIICACEPVA